MTWHPSQDGGIEELRSIDRSTVTSTALASFPGRLSGVNQSDADAGVIYSVAFSSTDPRARLFSIAARSGALLANPVIATSPSGAAYNWSA